ncbi:C6 transcription factor [Cladophialophora carrionii]|uniref:C6 transcription factor n=1 Tax=Cladophialophora carrionii TaxID=86049 RepID=A0A1C1CG84_9EURO|nr:C6 transcription factor [Cladophialophora carrionii]
MADAQVLKRRIGSGKACTSCRRRKNRCDGNRPSCGSCQSRGIRCAYPSVSVDELSLEELKSLIDLKSQGNVDAVREGQAQVQPQQHRRSSTVTTEPEEGQAGLGALLRASAEILRRDNEGSPATNFDVPCFNDDTIDVSIQNNAADNQTSPATTPPESQDSPAFFGESSTFAFVSKVQSNSVPRQAPVSRNKRRRLSGSKSPRTHSLDSGLTPRDVDDSWTMPPRDLADSLVDSYFNHVHRLYPFVHEPTFRSQYERMWMHDGDHPETKATWFALLNLIFAHGYEFHNPIQGRSPSHSATQFLVKARNIVFAHIFKEGNLELVQALLLMCHYLQGTLELNECWSLSGLMIRTSISMGLHLNPSPSTTAVEREVRKRVWWGCFVIDRTLSMKFGRPPSIPTVSAADVELPLPVDDQYIMNDSIIPRQPASCPSLTSFFIQTIKLAHIIDSVLLKLYPSTGKPWNATISQVRNNHDRFPEIFGHSVLLDGELLSWWNGIPHHLRDEPNNPDGSDFQRQRNVMYIRWAYIRAIMKTVC